MRKVIAVVGPTASGKTSLGIYLAQKLGGEIISADSRQVYKGLDIGTGKVNKKEMAGVPHHLLSVASPRTQYTVDHFVKKSNRIITMIYHSGHTPIVVGGTGLYVDMLLGRMSYAPVPPNPALRKTLEKKSLKQLLAQLRRLDPKRAATVEPHHKRRLIRAIEIAKGSRKTPDKKSGLPSRAGVRRLGQETRGLFGRDFSADQILWLGLNPKNLKKNIHQRLQARLKLGMVAEAKRLHKQGLSYKRMEELGLEYRYLARLLQGALTKQEFELELEREINRYAKRQWRWFKRNQDIHWVKNKGEALKLSKKFLSGR